MVAVPVPSTPAAPDEQRVLLTAVPWKHYCRLVEMFDERPALRLTYLHGALEIMTTSARHEFMKSRARRLIEEWLEILEVDLRPYGQTTFREETEKVGLEADECYTIGQRPRVESSQEIDRPDIAIEIVVSHPLVDKLAVYAVFGVPEVWQWRDGVFRVFVLEGKKYVESARSRLVPAIDLAVVAELANIDKQIDAVKELRARVSGHTTRTRS
jgi:Uma2 family endonuclease